MSAPAADRGDEGADEGATISHAKQRIVGGRYLGLTEPGIIAAEAPNPIVNELVILPDIESAWKPSSASATGHHLPRRRRDRGGVPHLLGILMHPDNQDLPFPVILTGPAAPKPTCSSSMNSSGRPSAMRRSATTGSSSTTRPRWPSRWPRA